MKTAYQKRLLVEILPILLLVNCSDITPNSGDESIQQTGLTHTTRISQTELSAQAVGVEC